MERTNKMAKNVHLLNDFLLLLIYSHIVTQWNTHLQKKIIYAQVNFLNSKVLQKLLHNISSLVEIKLMC